MWDKRYAGETYAYGTQPNDFLRDNAQSLPVGDTLCLGEGEGRNAVFLAGLGVLSDKRAQASVFT